MAQGKVCYRFGGSLGFPGLFLFIIEPEKLWKKKQQLRGELLYGQGKR